MVFSYQKNSAVFLSYLRKISYCHSISNENKFPCKQRRNLFRTLVQNEGLKLQKYLYYLQSDKTNCTTSVIKSLPYSTLGEL